VSIARPGVEFLPAGKKDLKSIEGPLTVWRQTFIAPREMVVHFLKIDLTAAEIEVFVHLTPDPDGPEGPAEGILDLPKTIMQDSSVLALINANAFSGIESIDDEPGQSGWYRGRPVNIEGLAAADGSIRSPDQHDRLPFWLDEHGRPNLGHPGPEDRVYHAVSDWFSPLIVDGKIAETIRADEDAPPRTSGLEAPVYNQALHPRTMLGFDESRTWLLFAVVDGRRLGHSLGMTLLEQAQLMQDKGCSQAINLDGGGSSIMLIRGKDNAPVTVNRPSGGAHRPVPVMIGVRLRESALDTDASNISR
jgi:hypothetical protein